MLDKKCEHRATVDLVDEKGRKQTGGKLTVVARLREPLTGMYSQTSKIFMPGIGGAGLSFLLITNELKILLSCSGAREPGLRLPLAPRKHSYCPFIRSKTACCIMPTLSTQWVNFTFSLGAPLLCSKSRIQSAWRSNIKTPYRENCASLSEYNVFCHEV